MTDPLASAKALKLAGSNGNGHDEEIEFGDPDSLYLDWAKFWAADHDEAEWCYPDVLARGRGHAIYATHKLGKSLFMLWVASQLATGPELSVVSYFDYEMTEADVHDRLADMGFGAESDLSRLRYALLPSLPPLDTPQGATALIAEIDATQALWPTCHQTVIIDTISRAISGEENDADTFRNFYNFTGIQLKRRGITWARLDHAGKDSTRGQRGSSSKGDDVDLVWNLVKTDSGIELRRDFCRMGWCPDKVAFGLLDDPLRYQRLDGDWPEHTREVANILDRLDVPATASARTAGAVLKEHGEGRRQQIVSAALRYRRSRLADYFRTPETPPETLHTDSRTETDADAFPF